jgi:hypothetical protein
LGTKLDWFFVEQCADQRQKCEKCRVAGRNSKQKTRARDKPAANLAGIACQAQWHHNFLSTAVKAIVRAAVLSQNFAEDRKEQKLQM